MATKTAVLPMTLAGKAVRLPLRRITVGYVEKAQAVKAQLLDHVRTTSAAKAVMDNVEIWQLMQAAQGRGQRFTEELERRKAYVAEQAETNPEKYGLVKAEEIEADVKAFYGQRVQQEIENDPAFAKAYLFPEIDLGITPESIQAMLQAVPQIADTTGLTPEQLEELQDTSSEAYQQLDVEELGRFCENFCSLLK